MSFLIIYLLIGFLAMALELTFSRKARENLMSAKSRYRLHPILVVTFGALVWPVLVIRLIADQIGK